MPLRTSLMKTFKVTGCIELNFIMEVEAMNSADATEEACQIIDQEKLDAFDIEGTAHLLTGVITLSK